MAATLSVRIAADDERDPVFVEMWGIDEHPVELRIGERETGKTRYVLLTRAQARAIARALDTAVETP